MRSLHTKDAVWVHSAGRIFRVSTAKKSRSRGENETTELEAPFSCKVLKVSVTAGQTVKKGEPIVVVEAMKMEYTYYSPRDGKIDALLVQIGQILQAGQRFVSWSDQK